MICKNRGCKHQSNDNKCTIVRRVKIDMDGKCVSFEKGFLFYFDLVYDALRSSNFIPANKLTKDLKIGLYYVMKTFDLGFSEVDMGAWFGRAYMLKDGKNGKGLTTDEIIKRDVNKDSLMKIIEDCSKGILPGAEAEEQKPKKTHQPFGWLSPTGEFIEGDFAEHEAVAHEIIKKKGFLNEFCKESAEDTARDFLSRVKGYVLIHNPAGFGGYIVSHEKPLTKKQKDFLYGYFIDMGDSLMANAYVDD